jgi:hypothetical protein
MILLPKIPMRKREFDVVGYANQFGVFKKSLKSQTKVFAVRWS